MIGVAAVIIFIIIKLLGAHGSDPHSGTYSNQTSTDTSGGQTSTDTSGGQTSTGHTPTPVTPSDSGAGATGDLGNGSGANNPQPTQSSGDPGASGNL